MQIEAPFVVYDKFVNQQYNTYTTYDDDYVLSPSETFFIQRPVDQASLVFPLEGRQGSAAVVDRGIGASRRLGVSASGRLNTSRTVYNLTLTNGNGLGDRTRFVLNPQASLDYDDGCDAPKFESPDPQVAQLYTFFAV